MNLFRSRKSLRRWSAMAALLWLLAVGVNAAQACIVAIDSVPAPAAVQDHDAGHHAGTPAKSGNDCRDQCDKASLFAAGKSSIDAGIPCAVPPHGAAFVTLAFGDAPLAVRPARTPAPSTVPLSIRFVRLAL